MARMRTSSLLLLIAVLSGCGTTTVTRTIVVTATPAPVTAVPIATAMPTAGPVPSSPADFTLQLRDVGANYLETAATSHSNAQVAATYHLSPTALRRRGRLTSYETQFSQQQPNGILQIDDVVAAWRTNGGAQWDFQRVVKGIFRSTPPPQDIRAISVPGLGDTRRAITFHAARQPANLIDYALVFRRGRYRVYVQVVGVFGTVDDSDVTHLARIVDRRIQQAAT
jgi:hypothetical protein